METAKLSQHAVAERLKTTQSTVRGWLNGALPRERMMPELAQALGVNAHWLRTGDSQMNVCEDANTLREEPTLYRVEPRAGKGSMTGINPQPQTSAEMLAACHLFLSTFNTINTPQALDWAVTGLHQALEQYRALKHKELQP